MWHVHLPWKCEAQAVHYGAKKTQSIQLGSQSAPVKKGKTWGKVVMRNLCSVEPANSSSWLIEAAWDNAKPKGAQKALNYYCSKLYFWDNSRNIS